MNLLDFLTIFPTTSVGNGQGQQMRIQIFILGLKGFQNPNRGGHTLSAKFIRLKNAWKFILVHTLHFQFIDTDTEIRCEHII